MNIGEFIFGARKSKDARAHQIIAQRATFSRIAAAGRLRQGMWVRVDNKTGILTALDAEGKAEVMLIRADGSNLIAVIAQADAVQQATFEDIPENRRPSRENALAFGYTRKRTL